MRKKLFVAALTTGVLTLAPAGAALAHVHAITPLNTLADDCGVTTFENTGANRAQGSPILEAKEKKLGPIPIGVGNAELAKGDGGFSAPVGCAETE